VVLGGKRRGYTGLGAQQVPNNGREVRRCHGASKLKGFVGFQCVLTDIRCITVLAAVGWTTLQNSATGGTRYRYGEILYFAKLELGDDTVLDIARVHMFPAPERDAVHEMPTFSALPVKEVLWLHVTDIGEPVILDSLNGRPSQRMDGQLVALGGRRDFMIA
jgi:hypothetical protein